MTTDRLEFTREFARLVWLLVHRPALLDEQKAALRRSLAESGRGRRVVVLTELNHALVDVVCVVPPPPELSWLSLLAARMAEHSVGSLDFDQGAQPADVLGVARALAAPPFAADDGVHFGALIAAVAASTVSVAMGRTGFARHSTPQGIPVVKEEAVVPTAPHPPFIIIPETAPGRMEPPPSPPTEVGGDAAKSLVEAAFTRGTGEQGLEDLYRRMESSNTPAEVTRAADDLVRTAESRSHEGEWDQVAEIFDRLIAHEEKAPDGENRRGLLIHVRRLATPRVLRALADLLLRRRDLRETIHRVLAWTGEDGADVLIDLLVTSEQASERRVYRTAIAACPAAVVPLSHLLDDDRWYVVRNAVELLGELKAIESDARVAATLKHPDSRVRRSAATALAKLATARTVPSLIPLLHDSAATVRMATVHALGALRNPRAVAAMLPALDREHDVEVQQAMYGALASHPTDEAVERLAQATQPGSLLNRRSAAVRLPAVHALAEAGTTAAFAALQALANDRDREVRATVERLLASRASRAPAGR